MWIVYRNEEFNDPKYGKRVIEYKEAEGSLEFCEAYVQQHPGTYIRWYCI